MTSTTKASALEGPAPVTVTSQELGVVVDLAANANAPVGRVLQLGDLFQRLVRLANSTHPIGEIVPCVGVAESTTYADRNRVKPRDADTTFPA